MSSNLITLLHGLPRVGRSRVVGRWCKQRDDAELLDSWPTNRGTAAIRVIDHMRENQVDEFVDFFRALEAAENEVRFVLLPVDLTTTRRLQDALTGTISLVDLIPLQLDEYAADRIEVSDPTGPTPGLVPEAAAGNVTRYDPDAHWLRGGLPQSLDAESDLTSLAWRRQMLSGLLVRNYTSWSLTAATKLPEILRWVANQNGNEFDETGCPVAKRSELLSALHVFERLGLTRRLANFPEGADASLAKKPKLYVRDSGILHALLGIETIGQLRRHPAVGECWESYALECLIVAASGLGTPQFYRAKGPEGAEDEIDLVLDFSQRQGPVIAIECKTSPNTTPKPGFYRGMKATGATEGFVVHSGPSAVLESSTPRLDLASAIARVSAVGAP